MRPREPACGRRLPDCDPAVQSPIASMPSIRGIRPLLATFLFLATALVQPSHATLGTIRVASGLRFPDFVTAPPGDYRLFIVERRGVIKILRDGVVQPTPFMDIDSLVMDLSQSPETGLTGLAFHPEFSDSPFVYVFYVDNLNETVVARYEISSQNSNVVDYSSAKIYLAYPHPYLMHYGGHLAFGPDGYLYVSIGDGGHQGDPEEFAQNPNLLYGKILRLDVNHPPPYTIPPDNPFVGDPAWRPEVWDYGLRNPYRFSFDRATGTKWIGDVGQDRYEEVDVESFLSPGGVNYGWPYMEADSCYHSAPDCGQDTLVARPIFFFDHITGCAVVGGYVYRGSLIPEIQGQYFCGEYCYGLIWSIDLATGWVTDRKAQLAPGGGLNIGIITGFGEDGFGELYIVDYGTGTTGEIYKIVDKSYVGVDPVAPPGAIRFLGPAPNPATGSARFSVQLAHGGSFDLAVVDATGRAVAHLASGPRAAGSYAFVWNGETQAGRRAAAGTYRLRASLDGHVTSRSVVYI